MLIAANRSSSARTGIGLRRTRSLSRSQSAPTAAYWYTTATSTGRPGTVNIRICATRSSITDMVLRILGRLYEPVRRYPSAIGYRSFSGHLVVAGCGVAVYADAGGHAAIRSGRRYHPTPRPTHVTKQRRLQNLRASAAGGAPAPTVVDLELACHVGLSPCI